MQEAIGMVDLEVGGHAFWTQAAFVHWEIVARLETNDVIILNQKIHPALYRAVRTMRRHNLVDHTVGTPTVVRRVMKGRPEGFNDLLGFFALAHILSIVTTCNSRPLEDSGVLLR